MNNLEAWADDFMRHRRTSLHAREELRHERNYEELELENLTQNIQLRKLYAGLLFSVLVFWIFVIMYVVLSTASGCQMLMPRVGFHLSDAVVITLITTTTANVVGFFFAVTNYLFPKGGVEMKQTIA